VPCDYSGNHRRRPHQTKDYRGLQDRLTRVEALLSASPPRTLVPNERTATTVPPAAASSQNLFQSFTLQMEKIEDPPAVGKPLPTTFNDVQPTYTSRDDSINEPPAQVLSFDNLTTFSVPLPTLPPTPSSHHANTGAKTGTACDYIPLTDQSTFSSPGEDDGSSTAPPEQEVCKIPPCSN
jgi:hypothetical protein